MLRQQQLQNVVRQGIFQRQPTPLLSLTRPIHYNVPSQRDRGSERTTSAKPHIDLLSRFHSKRTLSSRSVFTSSYSSPLVSRTWCTIQQTRYSTSNDTNNSPFHKDSVLNTPLKPPQPKKPMSQRIKDELVHYWDGSKLLATEVRISSKLVFKILRGEKLIRREKRQVTKMLYTLKPWVGLWKCCCCFLAQKNFTRFASISSLCLFCYCSIHGVVASCGHQTVP
jgi:hypothetical protein